MIIEQYKVSKLEMFIKSHVVLTLFFHSVLQMSGFCLCYMLYSRNLTILVNVFAYDRGLHLQFPYPEIYSVQFSGVSLTPRKESGAELVFNSYLFM